MQRMLVIGLMSGTSADSIDAALVEWPDTAEARPFRLLALHERAMPPELQSRIHALAAGEVPGARALEELAFLDVLLGERFAEAARGAADDAGVGLADVDAIASHGQTVAHHPEHHATLQIGDPSIVAERTGVTTVADFRPRDMALGGEGAPLAPFFHHAAFSSSEEDRVALNLGGIANLSWLPRSGDPDDVVAFDVGPANSILDSVIGLATAGSERMDRDGARGARGRVDEGLLERLLDDDYLRRPPPKSTGRERYGSEKAAALWQAAEAEGRSLDDLVATLTAFTVQGVALACREILPAEEPTARNLARLLVGGGGAANPTLLAGLRAALPGVQLDRFDAMGVPVQAAEAMAFSLMGRNTLLGISNHLPRCTGASRAAVLGEIVPGLRSATG
jgi:anhydro-N-acetylmuramic acid kinase